MAEVSDEEVLLLWRALTHFRTGKRPVCAASTRLPSPCPLFHDCPRWTAPDDYSTSMSETLDQTELRRAGWPCSRILGLLGPETHTIGP